MPPHNQKSRAKMQIDENLKRVYQDAASEELPEKFLDLIAQLKAKEEPRHGDDT